MEASSDKLAWATLRRYFGVIVIGFVVRAIVFARRDADPAELRTPNAER